MHAICISLTVCKSHTERSGVLHLGCLGIFGGDKH